MADEYIRKQDAVDLVNKISNLDLKAKGGICVSLANLQKADVVPVVHGAWLPIVSYNNTYKCSECGRLLVDITDGLKMVAKNYPYCHCGAKMDGERKE